MAQRLRNFDELMENETPFDLNERLDHWRSALMNRPAIREEDIEELESHLSDTMDVLVKSGLSQEEAFLGQLEGPFPCPNASGRLRSGPF